MTQSIRSPSGGEAVLQMETTNRAFPMFRNHANGRFNLFRRDDGNAGRVDPAGSAAS